MTYTYLADGTKVSAVSGCGYGLKYRGSFMYETGYSMDDRLPFGTRVQNASFAGVEDNRYRYAGKEEQRIGGTDISLLDFGARYYDPYVARWTSIDPMADKFSSFSPFGYCGGNPILNLDKDGRIWDTAWDIANVVMDVQSLVSNIKNGNTKDAVIDGVGLVGDLAAAALPFIPGGAGAGIKAARAGDKVVGAINSVDNVVDMSRATDTAVDAKKTLQETAKIGQEAHRQIEKEIVLSNPGSKAEATITINKKNYRKDVKLQDDTYVIIKPDTPSGHVSGEKRKQLLESDNKRSIIHYYDPNDSRWLPSSPTYIGPKKK